MLTEAFPKTMIVRNEAGRPVVVVPDAVRLGLERGISALAAARVDLGELTVGASFPVGEAVIWEARAEERGTGKLFVQVEMRGKEVRLVVVGCIREVSPPHTGLVTISIVHEELTSAESESSLMIAMWVDGNPRNKLVKKYLVNGRTVMETIKSREEFRLSDLFARVFGKESEYLTLGEAIQKLLRYT